MATSQIIDTSSPPVTLTNNGTLMVEAAGIVAATKTAVVDSGTIAVLTNAGTISSATSFAISAQGNIGTLTNSGLIEGFDGIVAYGSARIDNETGGRISAQELALNIGGTGTLINDGTISSQNIDAVQFSGAHSVLENAGTIAGGGLVAIQFGGTASSLILDPSSVISGEVVDTASDGTLVIGGAGANSQIFSGDAFSGFTTVAFESGSATLAGSAADLASVAITGVVHGDSITLNDFAASGSSVLGDELILSDGVSTTTLTISSVDPLSSFVVTSSGDTTNVADQACYVRGTRIQTSRGPIAIEALAIGDAVVTESGALRPVRWLGRRGLDCAKHPRPASVWPVCVSRDAFGPGLPARDLWLSPAHAVSLEGVLIPVSALVNGVNVVQHKMDHVEYWHVELDSHDVILAEGQPAESYVDTGNRAAFENGGAFLELYPNFRPLGRAGFCRRLVLEGPEVRRASAALTARLGTLGMIRSADAAPFVMADGGRVDPIRLDPTRLAFVVPEDCARIALMSRRFVPAAEASASGDRRMLGLCVTRLQIDGADIPLDDDGSFGGGWYAPERDDAMCRVWRWTDGAAVLPARTRLAVIDTVGTRTYWVPAELALSDRAS